MSSNVQPRTALESTESRKRLVVVADGMRAFPVTAGLVLAVLLGLLYAGIVKAMAIQWYADPDYSHGFIVPLLSAFFVWERRREIANTPLSPNWIGAGALAVSLSMLLLGSIGAEIFVQRVSLILVIASLVWFISGSALLRALAFPIAFLFFMVPLPAIIMNAVAFPLQLFAAKTASACLVGLGIPVLREGNVIMLAHTTLEVVEACSGIRSLQALLSLSAVYAYFTQTVRWKQIVLVAAAIPIAIAANAFRVSGTGVLAHSVGTKAADGFYHSFSGLLVFGFAFILLLATGTIVSRIGRNNSASEENSP